MINYIGASICAIVSVYLLNEENYIWAGIMAIAAVLYLIFLPQKDQAEKEKSDKQIEKQKELAQDMNSVIEVQFKKADKLQAQLLEIQKIEIIEIADFKKIIVDNEKSIIDKGGDNQLFSFLKIDSFLRDFRERIINDQIELNDALNFNWLKTRIIEEAQRNDIEKIDEYFHDALARLEGRSEIGFDAKVKKLFDLGNKMKPVMEYQIKTMEYYKNMAVAMIVFYLSDKKIKYFEIYEAFEKLGVFDSTWQKNVLSKLDNIEIRLAQMSNQLTELNKNFIALVESSENIISELNEINSSIVTNNMLQAIAAYQTWRINKNIKSLK